MSDSVHQIRNLIYRYAFALDAGDFDAVADLFSRGAFRRDNDVAIRGDEIANDLREVVVVYDDGTPRTRHVTSNVMIEVDEALGTARASSYVTVLQALPGATVRIAAASRYDDRFERVDERWHFAERHIHGRFLGDMSGHAPSLGQSADFV